MASCACDVADGQGEDLASEDVTTSKKKDKFNHPVYKQLSMVNGEINRYTKLELVKSLNALRLDTTGSKNVLIKRLKNFYKKSMLSVAGIHERSENVRKKILFDYFVVIDFEATCQLVRDKDFKQEIIEFPAVLLNCRTCEIEDEFRSFCRPVINPLLTEFCTELTGITQDDVDGAPLFSDALASFDEWVARKKLGSKYSFAVVTDGPWDMGHFLKNQCQYSGIEYPTFGRYWVNVRKVFSNFYKTGRMPLSVMIQIIGRDFEGRAHCGLDDARNIAFIVQRLLQDGARVALNEKLVENDRRRDDGSPIFAETVEQSEFKSIQGQLRPNFPVRKPAAL